MDRAERPAIDLPAPPRLRAADIALFLDVDGTLLEIEREPGAVHVPDQLCRILEDLQAATGGRACPGERPLPGSARSAVLAALPERRRTARAGAAQSWHRAWSGPRPIRRSSSAPATRLAAFADATPGVLLEDKGLTLALHYRKAPAAAAAAIALAEAAVAESDGALGPAPGQDGLRAQAARRRQGTGDRRVHGRAAVCRAATGVRRRRRDRRSRLRHDQPDGRHLDPDRRRQPDRRDLRPRGRERGADLAARASAGSRRPERHGLTRSRNRRQLHDQRADRPPGHDRLELLSPVRRRSAVLPAARRRRRSWLLRRRARRPGRDRAEVPAQYRGPGDPAGRSSPAPGSRSPISRRASCSSAASSARPR